MATLRAVFLASSGFMAPLVTADDAAAAVTATRCNACSASQYHATGLDWARAHDMARGYVFVYDVPAGQMKKYSVKREPGPDTWNYTLGEVPLTPEQASTWTQARTILQANGGSTLLAAVDPRNNPSVPDRNATAYEIALTSAYRNDVDAYLMDASSNVVLNNTALTMASIFDIATVFLLEQDMWTITVTWITIDGGKTDFQWRAGNNHTTITRMIDADGNTIPVNEDDIAGLYRFGTGHERNFRDYMNIRFGGRIEWGENTCLNGTLACAGLPGGPPDRYRCNWHTCGGFP